MALTDNPEVSRYRKCYAHLARKVVPPNDSRIAQIISKSLSGAEACKQLLNTAKFDSSGSIDLKSPNFEEASAVLQTMNEFHRSWFPSFNFQSLDLGAYTWRTTQRMYYSGEMALFLTNALFSNRAIPFSSIVTSPTSYKAIRYDRISNDNFLFGKSHDSTFSASDLRNEFYPKFSYTRLNTEAPKELSRDDNTFMRGGQLIGITSLDSLMIPPPVDGSLAPAYLTSPNYLLYQASNNDHELRQSFGGGILGSRPFLMLNAGRLVGEKMDGAAIEYRRWSKEVFSSLFCRDIPVIRPVDAARSAVAISDLPFRTGISCMQCHLSTDSLASIHRNKILNISYPGSLFGNFSYFFNINVSEQASTTPPQTSDPLYYKRPPEGSFIFRNFKGELLTKKVTGVQEMGDYMATVDDLYLCAAKRYFEFFTGINVPLYDPGDFNSPKLSPNDEKYRTEIIRLGLELKNDQSLENMILKIISSPEY